MDGYGRAVLLDDGRPGDHLARSEIGALEHLRVNVSVVEEHSSRGAFPVRIPDDGAQGRAADRADAGDPQVDPLDLLLGPVPEAVAVELFVGVVERDRRQIGTDVCRDPYLKGLPVVAEIRGTDEA